MYLKELTLRGFKSFATATTLRFEPGITAIVGPNGSGKSNIVDALIWVMGEQSTKNLRGTAMQDVIFAGTSTKPPLGRAQVTLTIDNTDHTLDVDYAEVTISRTLFRSGGSQYAINGQTCRLLDIQELLSDTGLGQQMHVIVGQGQLDDILHADPAGHRAFIEEAAGILKHRKRKERALRKLEHTEANLTRLDDLLGEIHKQLGPLGRQARVSRRAQGIQVTLRDAQSRILADDAVALSAKREDVASRLRQARAQLDETQQEMTALKVQIERIEERNARSSTVMNRANQAWHNLAQTEERLHSLVELARERSRSVSASVQQPMGEDPGMLGSRALELDGQQRERAERAAALRIELQAAVERREHDETELTSLRQRIAEMRSTAQQREEQMTHLHERIARAKATLELDEDRIKDLTLQREVLNEELVSARHDLKSGELEANRLDGIDEQALDAAQARVQQSLRARDELSERIRGIESNIATEQATARAMQEALDAKADVSSLKARVDSSTLGRLADVLNVADGWDEAVSRSLGQFASAEIVADDESLIAMLHRIDAAHDGGAVLIRPLNEDSLPGETTPSGSLAALIAPAASAQDDGLAQRVCAAVQTLVSDIAAVATIEEAVDTVGRTRADGRMWRGAVTQTGIAVNAAGAAIGTTTSQSDLSLAARRDAAQRRADDLTAQRTELQHALDEANAACDRDRERLETLKRECSETQMRRDHAARSLGQARGRLETLTARLSKLDARINQTHQQHTEHRSQLGELTSTLKDAELHQPEHLDIGGLAARESEFESQLAIARDNEMNAKVEWAKADDAVQSLRRQADSLRERARAASERRVRLQALNHSRKAQAGRYDALSEDADALAQIVRRGVGQLAIARDRLQSGSATDQGELTDLRRLRDELEPQLAQLQASEHELDVRRERLDAEYAQLTQRIDETLDMAVDELVRRYGPDQPVLVLGDDGSPVSLHTQDDEATHDADDAGDDANTSESSTVAYVRAEQIKRLEQAKRDLAALGKVNPLALEEFDALEQRHRYLRAQREDVAAGCEDLRKLIKDIDATMVDVFASAFEDTATAFEQMFATLFPGGTGRLRLENPDDLLTTGVLVEASPAGKRVKQLGLLSGGERSLTALALLFAIFTARPSPFYVLDEVEAALDDVNLTRLLDALTELRKHAQLIVITHQQRTMAIADALYGVTMRTEGVTAVISEKLTEH